ncbi:hypothetical protein M8044_000513, partial [Columbia Basin potato purple top phytoplasma]|nr:hypothetical protein [Columbia Basin potato purple top phytoplasma]
SPLALKRKTYFLLKSFKTEDDDFSIYSP